MTVCSSCNCILVRIEGRSTVAGAVPISLEARRLADETGSDRCLVDLREAVAASGTGSEYDFAYGKLGASFDCGRIALLVPPGDHTRDFLATALVNAGRPIVLFHDADEACRYLIGRVCSHVGAVSCAAAEGVRELRDRA